MPESINQKICPKTGTVFVKYADEMRPARSGETIKTKNPKKILIVSSIFAPHIFGGAEVAAHNRAKLLAKRGHKVSIVTLRENNTSPAWGEVTPDGYRIYRINTPRQYTLFERTGITGHHKKLLWHLQDYFDQRNKNIIAKVLDDVQPDNVQIDNLIGFGFNALKEIGRRNVPTIYMLHDLALACFNTGMIRNGKTCKKQCLSCRPVAALRQAPLYKISRLGFVSPSQANLDKAKQYIPKIEASLTRVIRNVPEDVPSLPGRQPSNRVRLLYVGRLDPVKGIGFLLQTLEPLSRHYDFHLTILGSGPAEEKLRQQYGPKDWTTFRGFVSKKEVALALAAHDLYCIPSLVSESYGLTTAQALQLGTPVIGSRSGGTAELVRDKVTGLLVAPGNKKAWRKSFVQIFSDPDLLDQWQKNAVAHADEFNANTIGQAYDDFINKLTNKKQ